MTNEELERYVTAVAQHATGVANALTCAVRALQAQPGYDHLAFLQQLDALQRAAAFQQSPPAMRKAFLATLEQLEGGPRGDSTPN